MNESYDYKKEPRKKSGKSSGKVATDAQVNLFLVVIALAAMVLLALTKTILYFGPANPGVIRGIFSIVIYALSIIGVALAYLAKRKPSFELFLNAGVFVAALWFLA